MRTARRMPGHATIVAYLALFVALGGTSVAAVQLSRNSVKSRNIAPGQVKTSDLARNAVTSAKVKNGSLLGVDFAPGQLPPGRGGIPAHAVRRATRVLRVPPRSSTGVPRST